MHLKLTHFGPKFACILGRFLVHIEQILNAKRAVLSVDFICKMQWFLILLVTQSNSPITTTRGGYSDG